MKLYAGWYVVGFRMGRVLAMVAGPVQDRARAESLLPGASAAASRAFGLDDGDTFTIAWVAFPEPLQGKCNEALWLKPEFQEYDA